MQTNGRPIQTTPVPPGTPKWGAAWKTAVRDNYLSTVKPGTGVHGSFYSYRDIYLDLDPTYRDRFGRPLMRMTVDFHDNEIKQNAFLTDRFAEIIKAMGAREVSKEYRKAPYDITDYQTTHVCGGAIMGADPTTSAINRYLQSWDVPNLFVMGASAFPQNPGYNPTGTVCALAYWSAAAIRNQNLKKPGPLVDAKASHIDRARRDGRARAAARGDAIGRRRQPRQPGIRTNSKRALSRDRGRLRRLSYRSRYGQAVCRRPRHRNAVRKHRRTEHHAGSRHRHRRVDR